MLSMWWAVWGFCCLCLSRCVRQSLFSTVVRRSQTCWDQNSPLPEALLPCCCPLTSHLVRPCFVVFSNCIRQPDPENICGSVKWTFLAPSIHSPRSFGCSFPMLMPFPPNASAAFRLVTQPLFLSRNESEPSCGAWCNGKQEVPKS